MHYKNKLRAFLCILVMVFVFAGCKKSDTDPITPSPNPVGNNNNPPGQITISLVSSSWDTAKISWTKSIDPDNDSVTYNIYLNDTLKAQNFTGLNYIFRHLTENTSYVVKVVAVDNKLNERAAGLNFITKNYWLRFLRKVEYGSITGYSHQKTGQMVKANDGGYIIVGNSQLGDWPYGIINLFAMKIDSLGNKIWHQRYEHNAGNIYTVKVVNDDNGYIICGDEFFIKIDNLGNIVWHKTITLYLEIITGIGRGPDGSIYVIGFAPDAGNTFIEAVLGKYDRSGNLIWKKTFPRTNRSEFNDILIDSNNEIIVLGRKGDPTADFWIVKLNSDGNIIWEQTYYGNGYAFPENIIKTREGNYVFTGFLLGAYVINYFYLHMIDANGNSLWTYFVNDNHTRPSSVIETMDNSLIVAGGFQYTYSYDAALYKFDKKGNKIWENLYSEFTTYLINKTVIQTSDGGYIINSQKSKAYNTPPETDQIYIFKTDDKGVFDE